MKPHRLLVVDRKRARAAATVAAFAGDADFQAEHCRTLAAAVAQINAADVAAIVADLRTIGGVDGVGEITGATSAPLILTASRVAQAEIVACMKAGAADCLHPSDTQSVHSAAVEALRSATTAGAPGDEAHAEYVGHLSHELRTPLNVVMGYSDMLLDDAFGPLNDDQAKAVDRIHRQSRELLALVDKTLELSRLDRGRAPLKIETVDVAALLQEIAAAAQPRAVDKGLALNLGTPVKVRTFHTDGTKVRAIVECLVDNAIDFTESGSIDMRVESSGGGIRIEVSDTGSGIPGDDLEKIFTAFYQGDNAKGGRGNGLGLHLAQRLAAVLGGEIGVDTEVGKGSTFAVWIPTAPTG